MPQTMKPAPKPSNKSPAQVKLEKLVTATRAAAKRLGIAPMYDNEEVAIFLKGDKSRDTASLRDTA